MVKSYDTLTTKECDTHNEKIALQDRIDRSIQHFKGLLYIIKDPKEDELLDAFNHDIEEGVKILKGVNRIQNISEGTKKEINNGKWILTCVYSDGDADPQYSFSIFDSDKKAMKEATRHLNYDYVQRKLYRNAREVPIFKEGEE
jgi:hypothetical protein